MPLGAALKTAGGVAVNALADELRGAAVVSGDVGGEGAAVEDFSVHSGGGGASILAGDELDKGDAAAEAGGAVLEDGDAGDAAEGGEENVEVGVGEGVVDVGDV